MLSDLKSEMNDRHKVLAWLEHIGETDLDCINEVIEQCSKDKSARAYYISRYDSEVG